MSKPIATTISMDSGGKGSCNTPPKVTGPASTSGSIGLYAMGKPVLFNGNVLAPAPGTTPKGDPCTSPRVVRAISNGRTSKNGIAKVGDDLNISTNIKIASTSEPSVYVV